MTGGERTLLVDASVFITLAEVGRTNLLAELDGRLVVPEAVAAEVVDEPAAGRLSVGQDQDRLDVRTTSETRLETAANYLGRRTNAESPTGDVALLAHALSAETPVVVTDDKPLRKVCKALSIPISGSIGVLVRAVERGELDPDEANESLYAMDEVGARLSANLVKRAEHLIEDARDRTDD